MYNSLGYRIPIFLGLIILFLAMGCQTVSSKESKNLQSKNLLPVKVTLEELSNVYTGKEAIIVDMVFKVSNPNNVPVVVSQLEWRVSVENTRLAVLSVPEGIYVPAKGEAMVRKTYFLNAKMGPVNLLLGAAVINLKEGAEMFGNISKAIKEESALWNLNGEAYIDSDIGSTTVPFNIEWKQNAPPK